MYVFVRTNNTWSQQAYVKASNTGANDLFGRSIALSADDAAPSTACAYTPAKSRSPSPAQ